MSASEFSRRSGVRFTPGEDDLGPFMEAALVLESGRLILLMRYTAERENTLTVMSDGQDDPIEARSEFLDVFGLQPDTFEWIPNQGFVSID